MKFEIKYNDYINPTIEEQIVLESLRLLNKFLVNSAKNNANFNSKSYRMTIHARSSSYNKSHFYASVFLKYIRNYSISVSLRSNVLIIDNFGPRAEFLISDPEIFDKITNLFKSRLNIS